MDGLELVDASVLVPVQVTAGKQLPVHRAVTPGSNLRQAKKKEKKKKKKEIKRKQNMKMKRK
jgi:hypothetical protein